MVDVLPAPLGPSNPRMRPGCAVNDTWFTAVTLSYRFTTSRTSSILSDRAEERELREISEPVTGQRRTRYSKSRERYTCVTPTERKFRRFAGSEESGCTRGDGDEVLRLEYLFVHAKLTGASEVDGDIAAYDSLDLANAVV